MLSTLLLLSMTLSADADSIRVGIEGMTCAGCATKVENALDNVGFLGAVEVSSSHGLACAELTGPFEAVAVTAPLEELGYAVTSIEQAPSCSLKNRRFPENWADIEDLDVLVISRGDSVDLDEHVVAGKFTIYDFGAPWCAPCHVAEKMLKDYLRDHSDVAVRAIILDSEDAKSSFAMAAAQQHLMSAPGLPYFLVVGPNGRTVFKGSDVTRVLKKLDRKR